MTYESWVLTLEGAERLINIKSKMFAMSGDDAVEAHEMCSAMFMELMTRAYAEIVGDK